MYKLKLKKIKKLPTKSQFRNSPTWCVYKNLTLHILDRGPFLFLLSSAPNQTNQMKKTKRKEKKRKKERKKERTKSKLVNQHIIFLCFKYIKGPGETLLSRCIYIIH